MAGTVKPRSLHAPDELQAVDLGMPRSADQQVRADERRDRDSARSADVAMRRLGAAMFEQVPHQLDRLRHCRRPRECEALEGDGGRLRRRGAASPAAATDGRWRPPRQGRQADREGRAPRRRRRSPPPPSRRAARRGGARSRGRGRGRRARACCAVSACRKRSKTCGRNSARDADAGVADRELRLVAVLRAARTRHACRRGGVNLMALESEVPDAPAAARSGSPTTSARRARRARARSATPLASAAGAHRFDRGLDDVAPGRRVASSRSLPVMMRETSSRSSISWVCAAALRSMVSTARAAVSALDAAACEQLRPAEDRVERRAQLVRERGRNSSLRRLAASASCAPRARARGAVARAARRACAR